MYQDHFGLYTAPFALVPHLRFLYNSTAFEETMAHLVYGLEGGEDVILISGEIGSGKTLALHNLVTHVSSTYESIVINITQVGFNELLKLALAELNVEIPAGSDRADLLTALNVRLSALRKDGRRLLLIIDEAQNLSTEVLEGVRLLTNLGPADVQMTQVILCGQPGLRTLIDSPELVQLRQRIRVHYHLHTLSLKETKGYITHRLEVAGCERDLFTDGAVARVHELSGGVPRLVNILADRGLLDAYVHGADHVAPENISGEEIVRSPVAEVASAATASAASETLPPVVEHEPEPDRDPDTIRAYELDEDDPDVPERDEAEEQAPTRRRAMPWVASAAGVALVLLALVGWRLGWFESEADLPPATPVAAVAAAVEDSVAAEPSEGEAEAIAVADTSAIETTTADSLETAPDAEVGDVRVDEPVVAAGADLDGLTPLERLDGIYIHVGSFREMDRAAALADACGNLDLDASICSIGIDGVTWLRVYVGPWQANGEAVEANTLLLNEHLTTWTMIVRFP